MNIQNLIRATKEINKYQRRIGSPVQDPMILKAMLQKNDKSYYNSLNKQQKARIDAVIGQPKQMTAINLRQPALSLILKYIYYGEPLTSREDELECYRLGITV